MTRSFISRLRMLVTAFAALGLIVAAGFVAPVDARGANRPQCSVQQTGYTGMLRTRCVATRPSATTRKIARRIPRTDATCSIGYLAALDPDAVRRWC
jgi:hypothetical protein